MIANDLNNIPICLGSNFKDLGELDLLTPNRLLLGRNNRRSLSGPCTVDVPSRMLEAAEAVFSSWWSLWNDTKLSDFVCKPPKWFRSSPNLEVGDIVIFCKTGPEQKLGQLIWTVGRVVEANPSKHDGRVRVVKIEYSNASEMKNGKAPLRTTNRASRSVARLCKEGEVGLMQELAMAAREAARAEVVEQTGDGEDLPPLPPEVKENIANYFAFSLSFSGECSFQHVPGSVCKILRIHEDPWP
jgi:hypothetical protein